MTIKNAAQIYNKVVRASARQEREKAKSDPEAFIILAKARGYAFSLKNLEPQIDRLSDEEIAGIFNPGIGPRRHLFPK